MYLYEKKIVYLSLLQDGLKKASAGFVRVSREKDALVLDIHIKNERIFFGRKYSLFLLSGDRETEWGTITGQHGKADARRCVGLQDGIVRPGEKLKDKLAGEELREEDICGVLIRPDSQCVISGYWQESGRNLPEPKEGEISVADMGGPANTVSPADISAVREAPSKRVLSESIAARERENSFLRPAAGDKWEELQRSYKKVHPFGDERVFLSIEPKDFVVLQAPYQRLVNNSFLLHGFYNYRHMILGPDKELGGRAGNCFYLGVPGTYFEREKMVAIMFGFEGFECDGAVEIGKFGYYMRRVEL